MTVTTNVTPSPLLYPKGAENGPFNVSIEATPFSVSIEWMELSDNIPLVTGYNIAVENLVTNTMRIVRADGNSDKAPVTGLSPFTDYSFTVTAKYKYGLGPPSKAVVQRTKEYGKSPNCTIRNKCVVFDSSVWHTCSLITPASLYRDSRSVCSLCSDKTCYKSCFFLQFQAHLSP